MTDTKNLMDDAAIMSLIKGNSSIGREFLYDKYSGMMHGAVLRHTQDKEMAGNILIKVFLKLNKYKFEETSAKPLYQVLLQFTAETTKDILAKHQVPLLPAKNGELFPLLNRLLFNVVSFKDAVAEHSLSEEEGRKKLRSEVNQMRQEMKLKQGQVI